MFWVGFSRPNHMFDLTKMVTVKIDGGICIISAYTTVTEEKHRLEDKMENSAVFCPKCTAVSILLFCDL